MPERLAGVGGPAVAAGIGRDDAVPRGEGRYLVVPHAVVQEAAVQQDEGLAGAGVEPEQIIHDNQGVILQMEWQLRCHHGGVNETTSDLASEELTDRLTEVFELVGPLYRRTQRKV
ncbi:hypothetical protein HEK616_33780 [Streptomyces nigrescens]|uniref:Uncharacterized protein n=1 Tax=Streptomyces nigrescens TaxID=1920 RepID=A0ABM7ZUD7_STRNI|nr:hypothetical protein HEK616_33780 [Streptomyces nigrescens]